MYPYQQSIDPLSDSHSVVQNWGHLQTPSKTTRCYGHHFEVVEPYHKEARGCRCYIIPPHLQQKIQGVRLNDEREHIRASAHIHGATDEAFRNHRQSVINNQHAFSFHLPNPFEHHQPVPKEDPFDATPFIQKIVRGVYDAESQQSLPGKLVITAQGDPIDKIHYKQKGTTRDDSVTQALSNALNVFLFYLHQYKHNSIDGKGMAINSSVHFGVKYENAFWNGSEMVYGDGSALFKAFVNFLDVVGHELTHGVTGNRLEYEGEAGALNEHFSDVMGYLVYMYVNKLNAESAPWLLADGILQYDGKNYPLRSFKAPGTAYDIPDLGKDPQPAKYGDLYQDTDDNGGVHINSGIPNHAFYLFATALGGNPWEKAGLIWFTTMMTPRAFKPNASMKDFAQATIKTADTLFKEDQKVRDEIRRAWKKVEVVL